MDSKKKTIGYKGHQISREPHYKNAYIHWKYTVTGPLFLEPYETFNMAEAKNEISTRARKNPVWYQQYLNHRQSCRTRTVHTNCGCSVKPLNLENETCASEAALNMKKIRSKRLKMGKLTQNNEKKIYAS